MVDLAVEDQAHLVRAADVEVVADHLLEEDPARQRPVQHLGEGELGLQDRHLIPVVRGDVLRGERVRQPGQPLAGQRLDLLAVQAVADRLDRGGVVDRGEGVIQRGEPDPGLGGLALGVLVAVAAQPGRIGEVAAELQEERAEVIVEPVRNKSD
jgi:hypothetical protein